MMSRASYQKIAALFMLLCTSLSVWADCEKAKEYFLDALRMKEDSKSALMKKGHAYEMVIELCPSYAEAHNNLGDVFEKLGRYQEAIKQYKMAIKLKSDSPYPYFGIGDVYYKTKRYIGAVEWYEIGLIYNPNDTLARTRLAISTDLANGDVIKADTIRGMLSVQRGVGGTRELATISFGEDLIPFDFNKSSIREDAESQLDELGKALEESFGGITNAGGDSSIIMLTVHTDIQGNAEYNYSLSQRRARSVMAYLTEHFDIPKGKLISNGLGETKPLCTIDLSEACHALNRRVAIRMSTRRDLISGY